VQALGAYQHNLQSFKNTFLSRNFDQNMHKNALFGKIEKIAAALEDSAPKFLSLRMLGALDPDLRDVTPNTCYSYFLASVYSANVITVEKEQK